MKISSRSLLLILLQAAQRNDAFTVSNAGGVPLTFTSQTTVGGRGHGHGHGHENGCGALFASSTDDSSSSSSGNKLRMRDRLKRIVTKPISKVIPKAIAEVLRDATAGAVDLAIDEAGRLGGGVQKSSTLRQSMAYSDLLEKEAAMESETALAMDTIALAKTTAADAFALAESAIEETERALSKSKLALKQCREDVAKSISIAERSALQANISSQKATALAASAAISASSGANANENANAVVKKATELKEELNVSVAAAPVDVSTSDSDSTSDETVDANGTATGTSPATSTVVEESTSTDIPVEAAKENESQDQDAFDVSSLQYEDVDYHLSEMAPPFIGEDQCLVPGEAVVRVEKALDNSRRIFAGIDIMASVDDVWEVLTDYEHLQRVVPNLVVNDVKELFDGDESALANYSINPNIRSEDQCQALSKGMKGAKLKQVGGAKVIGINFSATVTLEVREWPTGIPDYFHFDDDVYEGQSRQERAKLERKRSLARYHFPRPFATSSLPKKDISMQSVENDDGEFRLYQGVWRMTPLPGCAPKGGAAMRLTYAVEISPRPYLPVALVEGRISQDLCNNLVAIRDYVSK